MYSSCQQLLAAAMGEWCARDDGAGAAEHNGSAGGGRLMKMAMR